jgi:uracil-DNA glycosylase
LSVRESKPGSHAKGLWQDFSREVISSLSRKKQKIVFVLWGAHAQSFRKLINSENHFVLEAVHPSPLSASRGFFGSKPFSKINSYLNSVGKDSIDWRLEQLLF